MLDGDICMLLCRLRGTYDLGLDEKITEPDEFVFNIHLRGNNGYKKELEYIHVKDSGREYDYYLFKNELVSNGSDKEISDDDILKLIVDAYVNLHCFFN